MTIPRFAALLVLYIAASVVLETWPYHFVVPLVLAAFAIARDFIYESSTAT